MDKWMDFPRVADIQKSAETTSMFPSERKKESIKKAKRCISWQSPCNCPASVPLTNGVLMSK